MKLMALDIWDDLRAKRLWPVAAALLIAAIAIPLFVMKPAAKPAPAPGTATPAAGQAPATPAVASPDESSKLGIFGKKDPFRPPGDALKPSGATSTATSGSPAGASASAPAAAGPTSSGSPPSGGPGSGAGSGSAGSGSTGPSSNPVPAPPARRKRTAYTYVIDIDFGRQGALRRRNGVPRLTVLPRDSKPVAVFLGVSANARRAVFLLNNAFGQSGQGTCRPSRATCTFLHLSTDPEKNGHRIVDDKGVTYVLRLRAIRRVSVREASRAASRASRRIRGAPRTGTAPRASRSTVFADEQR